MAGINLNKNYGAFHNRAWCAGSVPGLLTILMYR